VDEIRYTEGLKMNLYQVRMYKNRQWYVLRSYAILEEAQEWAKGLKIEYDIKEVPLLDAVSA